MARCLIYFYLFFTLNLILGQSLTPEKIDSYINNVGKDFNVPGYAVAVVKDNQTVLVKGYGFRKFDSRLPVDGKTQFGIASLSKSFTTMALALLVDEGRLDWDDRVIDIMPEFRMYDACATQQCTVLDLLVHHSGLPSISGGTVWYGSDYNRQEVIQKIRFIKPETSFRNKYAYQNIMYLVAGELIPQITGKSWEDFIKERIFQPLGMENSSTSFAAFSDVENIARPHAKINGKIRQIKPRNYDNVGPAAAINSSAIDLAVYIQLLLNRGNFNGQQIYSPKIAKEIWTLYTPRQLPDDFPDEYTDFQPKLFRGYALGWFIQDFRRTTKVYHSGGIDGFHCLLTMIPEKNLGIIVLANNENRGLANSVTNIILDLYWGKTDFPWYKKEIEIQQKKRQKERLRILQLQQQRVKDTKPSLELPKYCGQYKSQLYGNIFIHLKNDKLYLEFEHTKAFHAELTHWQWDTFYIDWQDPLIPPGLLNFKIGYKGTVSEIQLDQPDLLDVSFSELHPIKRVND